MFHKCSRVIAGVLIMSLLVGCSEGAGGGSQPATSTTNPVIEKIVMNEIQVPFSEPTVKITGIPRVTESPSLVSNAAPTQITPEVPKVEINKKPTQVPPAVSNVSPTSEIVQKPQNVRNIVPIAEPTPKATQVRTAAPNIAPMAMPNQKMTNVPTAVLKENLTTELTQPVIQNESVSLKVSALSRDKVCLSWDSLGEGIIYKVFIDDREIEETKENQFVFETEDYYKTYSYRVHALVNGEEIKSETKQYCIVKKISGNIYDSNWGETSKYYEIKGYATIPEGEELHIAPGSVLLFSSDAYFRIYGKVFSNGVLGKEIVFSSLGDVNNGGSSEYDNIWGGISVFSSGEFVASDTRFFRMRGVSYSIRNSSSYCGIEIEGKAYFYNCDINAKSYDKVLVYYQNFWSNPAAVAVLENGSLFVKGGSINTDGHYVLVAANSIQNVEIDGSTLRGQKEAFSLSPSGKGKVSIKNCNIYQNDTDIISASEEASIEFTNNTIVSEEKISADLRMISLGRGEFIFAKNTFNGNNLAEYPIELYLDCIAKSITDQVCYDNTYVSYTKINGVCLGGSVSHEVTIAKGDYAANNIRICEGGKVTIEAGTRFFQASNKDSVASFIQVVKGELCIKGTKEEPVVFSGCNSAEYTWDAIASRTGAMGGIQVDAGGKLTADYLICDNMQGVLRGYGNHSGIYILGEAEINNSRIKAGQYISSKYYYPTLYTIEVSENGVLRMENTDVSHRDDAAVGINTKNGTVSITGGSLCGKQEAFDYTASSGSLQIKNAEISFVNGNRIAASGDASVVFEGNQVKAQGEVSYRQDIYIASLGSGEFVFRNNVFNGDNVSEYPVSIDAAYAEKDRTEQLLYQNTYENYAVIAGLLLTGDVRKEVTIAKGDYAAKNIRIVDGGKITIEAGTRFFQASDKDSVASFIRVVKGELCIEGTKEEPIVFSGCNSAEYTWDAIASRTGAMGGIQVDAGGKLTADYWICDNMQGVLRGYGNHSGIYILGEAEINNSRIKAGQYISSKYYYPTLYTIEVSENGSLHMENTEVLHRDDTAIYVNTKSGNIIITGGSLYGKQGAFDCTVSSGKFSIKNAEISFTEGNRITASGDAAVVFEGNSVNAQGATSYRQDVYIASLGSGEFVFRNNVFNGGNVSEYPVSIVATYAKKDRTEQLIHQNTYENYAVIAGLLLTGDVKSEVTIAKGDYAAKDIRIYEGGKVTIEAGTRFFQASNKDSVASFIQVVKGELCIEGTEEEPVVFSGCNSANHTWEAIAYRQGAMGGIQVDAGGKLTANYLLCDNMQGVFRGYGNHSGFYILGEAEIKNSRIQAGHYISSKYSYPNLYAIEVRDNGSLCMENTTVMHSSGTAVTLDEASGISCLKACSLQGEETALQVTTKGGNVLVEGCELTADSTALRMSHSGNASLTVKNCILESQTNILSAGTEAYTEFVNNSVTADTYGINIYAVGKEPVIENNDFYGCRYTIYLYMNNWKSSDCVNGINNNNDYMHNYDYRFAIGDEVRENLTLTEGSYIPVGLKVGTNANVTLKEGVKFFIPSNGTIIVNGSLKAEGTAEMPILFTGIENALLPQYREEEQKVSVWSGVSIGKTGTFEAKYTQLTSGNVYVSSEGTMSLVNCDLFDAADKSIYLHAVGGSTCVTDCRINGSNYGLLISNSGDTSVSVKGNSFSNCDMAVHITGIGNGSFDISENTIIYDEKNQSMPRIRVQLYGLITGDELISLQQNSFVGCSKRIYISAYPKMNITIPAGEYIAENISIQRNTTMTVAAGAKFYFPANGTFPVYGTLLVNGNETEPVLFASLEENTWWKGTVLYDGGVIEADGCCISKANTAIETRGTLTLLNSTIEDYFYGIKSYSAHPTQIHGCYFSYADGENTSRTAVGNMRSDVIIDATGNYWGKTQGPSYDTEVTDKNKKTKKERINHGAFVNGEKTVDFSHWIGADEHRSIVRKSEEGTMATTGNYVLLRNDMEIPVGSNNVLLITRTYNSQRMDEKSSLGYGWTLNYDSTVTVDKKKKSIRIVLPDGTEDYVDLKTMATEYTRNTVTTWTVNDNQIYHVTDQAQNVYIFSGKKDGKTFVLNSIEDRAGNKTKLFYDENSHLTGIEDSLGRMTTITYEGDRIQKIVFEGGLSEKYSYNSDGMLVKVTNQAGYSESYFYDSSNAHALIKVCDEVGKTVEEVKYQKIKDICRIQSVSDANGETVTYTYSDKDSSVIMTDSEGRKITYFYDATFHVILEENALGELTEYVYNDGKGSSSKQQEPTEIWDYLNNRMRYSYDTNGNLLEEIFPDGSKNTYRYNESNQCICATDRVGVVTHYEYNGNGLLIREITELTKTAYQSGQSDESLFAVTEYEYYPAGTNGCALKGLIKSVTTPEGNKTTFVYDENGYPVQVEDALGNVSKYVYDVLGRVQQETSAEGFITKYEYDADGNVTGITLDNGEKTTFTYDYAHRVLTKTSAEGNCESFTYSAAGNLLTYTNPMGYLTRYGYDKKGNPVLEVQANGACYYTTYDAIGRPVRIEAATSERSDRELRSIFIYGTDGNCSTVTEVTYETSLLSYRKTSVYDFEGKLKKETTGDNETVTYSYYADGLCNRVTDAMGNIVEYRYDALKNCIHTWIQTESGYFRYEGTIFDRDGNAVKTLTGRNKVSYAAIPAEQDCIAENYEYNALGLVTKYTDVSGNVTEYAYDKDGRCRKESTVFSDGKTVLVQYAYGQDNQLISEETVVEADGFIDARDKMKSLKTTYSYDRDGRLTSESAPDGLCTEYSYDKNGNVISKKVSKNGDIFSEVKCTYDVMNHQNSITDENGNTTRYVYSAFGNLTFTDDPEGGETLYQYDFAGHKTAEVLPESLRSEGDAKKADRMVYSYSNGRLSEINFIEDIIWKQQAFYEYDKNGRVLRVTDANKGVTTYTYDKIGNVTCIQQKDGVTGKTVTETRTYDVLGRLTQITDRNGKRLSQSYDDAGNLTYVNDGGKITSYTYDSAGNMLTSVSNGLTTKCRYNALGLLLEKEVSGITEGSFRENYWYDECGRMVKHTDSNGLCEEIIYDAVGNAICQTLTDTHTGQVRKTEFRYDAAGNRISQKTPDGTVTVTEYDKKNRPVREEIRDGEKKYVTVNTYDHNDNIVSTTDMYGNTKYFYYDSANRCIKVVVEDNTVIATYGYDAAGNRISETDALGRMTKYTYNSAGQVTSVTDPAGNVSATEYDGAGHVLRNTDALGNVTSYAYGSIGLVTEATQPNGQKTAYSYDASGNLLKQTDTKKQVTSYTYDAAGNLLTKTVSGTVTEHYTYRPDGLVATRKDANGNVFTYEYNAFGELTRETAKNAKTGQTTAISYTYDKMGRLVSMSDSTGKTEYSYDALNRTTKKKAPNLDAVTWTYDLTDGVVAGYHKEVETSAGTAVETTYDRENRIVRTATTKDGRTSAVVIAYNADGSRKSVEYSDGTREEYTYFDTNAVKQVSNYAADGSLLSRFTYTYDANGNQTSVTKSGKEVDAGTTSYTYDSLGQLTKVTEPNGVTTSYSYDSVGNRTSETVSVPADVFTTGDKYAEWRTACQGAATEENYVFTTTYYYDNRNRLYWEGTRFAKTNELISDLSYQNDANGNLLRVVKRSFGSATDGKDTEVKQEKAGGIDLGPEAVHEYDAYNQVIRSETPQYIVVNTYNGEGLRVGKKVSEKRLVAILPETAQSGEEEGKQVGTSIMGGTGSAGVASGENGDEAALEVSYRLEIVSGGETFFLYDGENVIIEKANGRVSRNIYAGPLLLRVDGTGKAYEYLYNAHGDVVTLVQGGRVSATYDYDAFGEVTRETGAASNAVRYAGYRYDVETGLYYLNARMYNPHTGRFLQADTYAGRLSDPLSLNLYTYCLNNPMRYVDPSGHFAISATLVAIFAMAALNAGFEMFNQKVVQKREKMNWWLVGFEAAIGGIMGYGGAAMAGMMATGAGTMLGTQSAKQVTAGVLKSALFAGSYAAIDNMAHQTLDGRKLREVDYGSVITSAEIAACFSLAVSVVVGGVQNMRLRRAQKAQKAQAGKITEYAHWENPYRVDENELIAGGSNNSTSRLHSKINKIVVKFNCNSKYDTEEFARQLANQEKGMNELTVSEYLENRERFIAEGRTIEGNVMQQAARAEARTQKIAELRKKGFSYTDAMKQADEWLNTQAALHNPDQIAGGNPQIIGGIGDKKINSSIGAQWRYRIDAVDKQIQSLAETMTKEEMESTYLNIKLVYEILGE